MAQEGFQSRALNALVIGASSMERERIRVALAELAEPSVTVSEEETGDAVDLVLEIFDGKTAGGGLDRYRGRTPRPALFAVVPRPSPSMMKQALRAGADDILVDPIDSAHLTRALLRISAKPVEPKSEPQARCQVISLMGAGGGVGTTTICANLALALSRSPEAPRVAAIDLDLQRGGLEVALNLEPEQNLGALIDPQPELSEELLRAAMAVHPSGILLLGAPQQIEQAKLVTAPAIEKILGLMRGMFDIVIVDCGRHVSDVTFSVWEHSDRLLCVMTQSVHSMNCAVRLSRLLSRLALANLKPELIVNRFESGLPLGERLMAQTLGAPVIGTVARDDRTLESMQLDGADLLETEPNSALARGIGNLAAALAKAPAGAPQPKPAGQKASDKSARRFAASARTAHAPSL